VADDGVTDGQVLDRWANGVDPAGVLVAEDNGQLGRDDVGEPAVGDVEVGAAQPGAADPDDDVVRPGCLGSGTSSTWGGCPYACTRIAFMGSPFREPQRPPRWSRYGRGRVAAPAAS
jgi:hypothetical protein